MSTTISTRSLRGRDAAQSTAFAAYAVAWLGVAATFALNGAVRQALYADALGDVRAHQVSSATVLPLLAGVTWLIERRWPIATARDALLVGGGWALAAMAFDFGVGHYVNGSSWATLLHEYDLADGRLWGLVVAAIAIMPLLVRAWLRPGRSGP